MNSDTQIERELDDIVLTGRAACGITTLVNSDTQIERELDDIVLTGRAA